jgi:hypothetical protein
MSNSMGIQMKVKDDAAMNTPTLAPLKKFIGSSPTLFGVLVALAIFAFIIIIVNWFPRVSEAWDRNNSQVRSIYFTVVFFAVWVSRLWRWQRRSALVFWASLCTIFLLHTAAVLLYSTHFHPLLIREWLVLATAESIVIVFGVDWLTRRFSHLGHP